MWDDTGRSHKFKHNCFKGFLAIYFTNYVFSLFQSQYKLTEKIIFKEIMPDFKERSLVVLLMLLLEYRVKIKSETF